MWRARSCGGKFTPHLGNNHKPGVLVHPELPRLENSVEIENTFKSQSQEILNLYREYIPHYLKSLESAIENDDSEQLLYQSHKLNSAMKTIGFPSIAERLQYIERVKPDKESVIKLTEEIKTFVAASLKVLEEM